jgi:hypothetical protein
MIRIARRMITNAGLDQPGLTRRAFDYLHGYHGVRAADGPDCIGCTS